jgi:hypothetical protein
MNEEQMVNPGFYGGGYGGQPQQIQEIHSRNPMHAPNADMLTNTDVLKILQQYHNVMGRKQVVSGGESVYDYFFGFFNRQANITFYDIKEKPIYDIDFEITWIDFKMSRPLGMLTQDEISAKGNLKRYADIIFFRNVGAPAGMMNERLAEAASILQNISSGGGQGQQGQGQKKGGFGGFLTKIF